MGQTESLPFSIGAEYKAFTGRTIWKLSDGVKTATNEQVSIFSFYPASFQPAKAELARNYIRSLRTLRIPNVLRFIDGAELADGTIHVVTEWVRPIDLAAIAKACVDPNAQPDQPNTEGDDADGAGEDDNGDSNDADSAVDVKRAPRGGAGRSAAAAAAAGTPKPELSEREKQKRELAKARMGRSLGLHQIISAVNWLTVEGKMNHNNVCPNSIFVNRAGDWRLGGFDVLYKQGIPLPAYFTSSADILPAPYRSPELAQRSFTAIEKSNGSPVDSWSIGCLLFESFNGSFENAKRLKELNKIPAVLQANYKRLLTQTPAARLNPAELLDAKYFANPVVTTSLFLDHLALKSEDEKERFFTRFAKQIDLFPLSFCRYRLLPQLVSALEFGASLSSFSQLLTAVLRMGAMLSSALGATDGPAEYNRVVIPVVVKLFSSNERSVRLQLLHHLDEYAPQLTESLINETIFPHVLTGFTDQSAVLREMTVKSLTHFVPKLHAKNIDGQVLPNLARLQTDPEPAIRTNTTYCLAKIAVHLSQPTRDKVLVSAFTRALRDVFMPAKVAGLVSLVVTLDYYNADTCAKRIIPSISPFCVDPDKDVRDACLRCVNAIVAKLVKYSATKAEDDAKRDAIAHGMAGRGGPNGATAGGPGTAASTDATSKAGAIVSAVGNWAVNSISQKVFGEAATPQSQPQRTSVSGSQQQQQPQVQGAGAGKPKPTAAGGNTPSGTPKSNATPPVSNGGPASALSLKTAKAGSSGGASANGRSQPSPSSAASSSSRASASAAAGGGGEVSKWKDDDFFDDWNKGGAGDAGGDATPIRTVIMKKDKADRKSRDSKGGEHKKSGSVSSVAAAAAAAGAGAGAGDDLWDAATARPTANAPIDIGDWDSFGGPGSAPPASNSKSKSKSKSAAAADEDEPGAASGDDDGGGDDDDDDGFDLSAKPKSTPAAAAKKPAAAAAGSSVSGAGAALSLGGGASATPKKVITKKKAAANVGDWDSFNIGGSSNGGGGGGGGDDMDPLSDLLSTKPKPAASASRLLAPPPGGAPVPASSSGGGGFDDFLTDAPAPVAAAPKPKAVAAPAPTASAAAVPASPVASLFAKSKSKQPAVATPTAAAAPSMASLAAARTSASAKPAATTAKPTSAAGGKPDDDWEAFLRD